MAKVEISDSVLSQLERLAMMGINYAEEQTHKYLKNLAAQGPTTSEEKKQVAIAYVKEFAPVGGSLTDERAGMLVEAAVQARRASVPVATLEIPPTVASSIPSERPTASYLVSPKIPPLKR